MNSLIEFRSVSLKIGNHLIIDRIDTKIQRGDFVCVVGPSGCGKTSLLRLLAGLFVPTSGNVNYDGHELTSPRRDIAVVFQDYGRALLSWRDAVGNVALALEANKYPKSKRGERISSLLRTVGLADYANRYPLQMSGGMQQRLQIARCLAQEPSVLLMDEPFGALDAMTRQNLQDEVLALARSTGMTIFFVTHDLEEAIYLGNRVIGLLPNPGRIGVDIPIALPSERNQLTTREHPEFVRLRRELFSFIKSTDDAS